MLDNIPCQSFGFKLFRLSITVLFYLCICSLYLCLIQRVAITSVLEAFSQLRDISIFWVINRLGGDSDGHVFVENTSQLVDIDGIILFVDLL